MREIVLDTETTGLDPGQGHRIVEIGCIELVNRFPTGQAFHRYLNPERDVPTEAYAVHGLSYDRLKTEPRFAEIVTDLLAFLGDAQLVAHNGGFDLTFLNAELEKAKHPAISRERLVDTLMLARRKYPGGSNRLDDLCARYGIDNSRRTKHGALLDAELLAEVYLELIDARQAQLGLVAAAQSKIATAVSALVAKVRAIALPSRLTGGERDAHHAMVMDLGTKAIWNDYAMPRAPPSANADSGHAERNLAEKVLLADVDTAMAQDRVSGREVEIEVR
jgi:DNA polymerase-3 subunit epsilon